MTSPYTAVNEVRMTRWRDQPNDDDTAVHILSEQYPRPIATVLSYASSGIGPGRPERDKHARLIAAAPELLDVARQCAELAERWGDQGPLVQAARAAIAKAEGTQS